MLFQKSLKHFLQMCVGIRDWLGHLLRQFVLDNHIRVC